MYLHEQIHLHTSKRGPETLQQAHRDRNLHIHLAAEPSLCSADEWVGPQQGPPVLSWSPPVLAASGSLQSSTTSQPPHCKQTEYVERILTAASKAPAYVWQQFINILFYCVCWSNHRHRCGGPYWQERDTEFIFHILTKCVCCCILLFPPACVAKKYCKPEAPSFFPGLPARQRQTLDFPSWLMPASSRLHSGWETCPNNRPQMGCRASSWPYVSAWRTTGGNCNIWAAKPKLAWCEKGVLLFMIIFF